MCHIFLKYEAQSKSDIFINDTYNTFYPIYFTLRTMKISLRFWQIRGQILWNFAVSIVNWQVFGEL